MSVVAKYDERKSEYIKTKTIIKNNQVFEHLLVFYSYLFHIVVFTAIYPLSANMGKAFVIYYSRLTPKIPYLTKFMTIS